MYYLNKYFKNKIDLNFYVITILNKYYFICTKKVM